MLKDSRVNIQGVKASNIQAITGSLIKIFSKSIIVLENILVNINYILIKIINSTGIVIDAEWF